MGHRFTLTIRNLARSPNEEPFTGTTKDSCLITSGPRKQRRDSDSSPGGLSLGMGIRLMLTSVAIWGLNLERTTRL